MPFIDFAALKEALTIEQVATILGLQMTPAGNQLRSCCPACKSTGGRELVVTPSKGAFYCFSEKKGGDLIALAAHIRGESVKDAAVFLAGTVTTSTSSTSTVKVATSVPAPAPVVAPPVQAPETEDKMAKIRARLIFEHELVQALGLTPEVAQDRGIGWIKGGTMANRVLYPLFVNGVHKDYMGYNPNLTPIIKFPSHLLEAPPSNVVPLHKAG